MMIQLYKGLSYVATPSFAYTSVRVHRCQKKDVYQSINMNHGCSSVFMCISHGAMAGGKASNGEVCARRLGRCPRLHHFDCHDDCCYWSHSDQRQARSTTRHPEAHSRAHDKLGTCVQPGAIAVTMTLISSVATRHEQAHVHGGSRRGTNGSNLGFACTHRPRCTDEVE